MGDLAILLGEIVLSALAMILVVLLIEVLDRLRRINRTLIRVWKLLKNKVVSVTVVNIKAEAASYDHGDTVKISGDVSVDGVPLQNTTVALKITDSAETDFPLPDATTDKDGKFAVTWEIPSEVAPAVCTIYATANGMTNTATFTFNIHTRMRFRRLRALNKAFKRHST